ncbi:unnamed protein product [Pieris brassicae]|uniref:Partial AB-hydrolase lipase domain-containing protein n=1 Tax=Pieris brassicae TaxID=7116 RepID=A0A9P0T0P9_PIEBR|nr:unnamed protein product [Pieris brassicae]
MLMVISLVIFVAGSLASPNVGSAHKKYYKTHETIADAGYPVETHDVVTQDGYILELIRMPRGKNDDGKVRPPVLMMHGLSDYGGTYIALGPKQSLALRATALSVDMIYNFAIRSGLIELIGPNWGDQIAEIENQQTLSLGVDSRSSVGDILDGIINPNKLLPGASLKQYAHYGQNIRDKKFRQWNYGLQNLRKYGQLSPPEYDLRKITADVTMHYTVNDNLLSEQDVLNMAKVMPNVTVRKIPRDTFTHTDFVSADDAKELVVDFIVKQISGF